MKERARFVGQLEFRERMIIVFTSYQKSDLKCEWLLGLLTKIHYLNFGRVDFHVFGN